MFYYGISNRGVVWRASKIQNTIETHTETHHTDANTQNWKDYQLHKLFEKGHVSNKYFFALRGVLIFCWLINTLHDVIA